MGTACQWDGTAADATYVQIQVIDGSDYWTKPTLGDGYEALDGIAKEVYVIPELGGFAAGALTDKSTIAIVMNGGKASRDSTVQLLRTVVERLAKSQ